MQTSTDYYSGLATITKACGLTCAIGISLASVSCKEKLEPAVKGERIPANLVKEDDKFKQSDKKEEVRAAAKSDQDDRTTVVKNDVMTYKETILMYLRIHSFLPDGQVLITGDDYWNGRPLGDADLKQITQTKGPPVMLFMEGEGKVGDGVILVTYTETQELSNGETRVIHPNHYGIKSTILFHERQ